MATLLTGSKQLISQAAIGSYSGYNIYLRQYAWEDGLNSVTSTGTLSLQLYLYFDAPSAYSIQTWDGISSSVSGLASMSENLGGYQSLSGGEEKLILAKTAMLQHNSSGNLSGTLSASATVSNWFSGSTSTDVTARTIPRYASISSFSVAKRDETSVTFNWKTDSIVDYVWYSTNDGSSWTGYNTPDGTSGSFTVSSLSANTTYNFKLRVRRKDSQLNTTSSRVQQTTYNWPYVSAVNTSNLIIGNSQTLTLYNPLSRNVSVYMKKDSTSGTEFYSGTTSGTSITFTPTSADMYASIPNSQSGNCVYYCTYSSHTVSSQSGTFTINPNNCKPVFEDFDYSTDLSSLTGDNETIISGKTTTTITIEDKATGSNSATISKYRLECGSVEPVELNESSSTLTGTLVGCNDSLIKVTAIDSRGLETTVSKTVTNYKVYHSPTYTSATADRKNGIEAETRLNMEMNFFGESFGDVTNSITELKYRTKTTNSGASWSNWFTINISELTYNNDVVTLEDFLVHLNGSSGGFTIGTPYYIQLSATDELETILSELISVTDGKVGMSLQRDGNGEYHAGINEMPDTNYGINSDSINLKDGIYLNGTLLFWEE